MTQDPMMAIAIQLERIANAVEKQNQILDRMQSDLRKEVKTAGEIITNEIHLVASAVTHRP